MRSLAVVTFVLLLGCQSKTVSHTVMYSEQVRDSFEIYISLPPTFDSSIAYDVVYYCDANLNSGRKLRMMIADSLYKKKADSSIFVGIGHIGDFHELRRRDFILPEIKEGDTSGTSATYGQVEHFYQFLKTELIPSINKRFKTKNNNTSIIGHSLGGLFVFYCLFKNDSLFKNYYALSPSLWIDYYGIYHFNRLTKNLMPERNLYFSAGGLEVLNHIKAGTDHMNLFLQESKYQNLQFNYEVHNGETHNSQVEKSLKYILSGER